MADFYFDRDDTTVITLRVPRRLWDRYESQHKHFGQAIHRVREAVIDAMAARTMRGSYRDTGDPFWNE